MIFFFNDGIQTNMSGIEHAQIQRLNLFKHFQHPAKIMTRQYSNELHAVTNSVGIADDDFINMFDYFQNAVNTPTKTVTIKDLNINPKWQRKAEGINYSFWRNGKRFLYVRRRNDNKKSIITRVLRKRLGLTDEQ